MAKSSTAAKYRGMLEDAKKSASGRVKRVREKASKQEMVQAGAAVAGGAVHGWARASGYSEVGGFDLGYVAGGVALVASQSMDVGMGRSVALGIGSGMMAATVSEATEQAVKESKKAA